jgi:HSP20 family molecular chaperone IbpA
MGREMNDSGARSVEEEPVMNRLALSTNPLILGFDHVDRMVERMVKQSGDSYPPFNIEQVGETGFRIALAVAGFAPDDLSVQVEANQLVIRGRQAEQPDRVFLHRGLAARQFRRVFVLADGLEVVSAALDKGILAIDLRRPTVSNEIRTIAIQTTNDAPASGKAAAHRPGGQT